MSFCLYLGVLIKHVRPCLIFFSLRNPWSFEQMFPDQHETMNSFLCQHIVLISAINLGMQSASRKAVVEVWPCTKTDKNSQHSYVTRLSSILSHYSHLHHSYGERKGFQTGISAKVASTAGWRPGESKVCGFTDDLQ